jgi:predicted metal-binding protein
MSSFSLLLCNDCCCGTERKHPDFDHAAQRRELEKVAIAAGGKLRVVKCLDACSYSNVVVIRRGSGKKIWLGGIAATNTHEALCQFVSADINQELPPLLESCVFEPSRESQEVEELCKLRSIPIHES